MATFDELPVRGGVGPVHLNCFRTRITPRAGAKMPGWNDLAKQMPHFMDKRTASVQLDTHRWQGLPTLMFRGVARLRPFMLIGRVPVPLPDWVPEWFKEITMPSFIRDWMMPDVHTDSVGFAAYGANAFTVATLRRRFETKDDTTIRRAINALVVSAAVSQPALLPIAVQFAKMLGDIAIDINQRHFLAGRRSFRMGTAAEFGERGNHWIFETAAVERYSHKAYQLTTDALMGGAGAAVRTVWIQMGQRVADTYGKIIGDVEPSAAQLSSVAQIAGSAYYKQIAQRHTKLVP